MRRPPPIHRDIEDPPIVTKILAHLGLPTELPTLLPARSPPQQGGFDFT